MAPKKEREGRELELVKVVVGGEEMRGVAGAEAVRELGEGEALTE